MKKLLPISIVLFVGFSSCVKTVTKTCTCKTAAGTEISRETHSGDKKSAKEFEDKCNRKAINSSTTSNGVKTSTIVPCEVS